MSGYPCPICNQPMALYSRGGKSRHRCLVCEPLEEELHPPAAENRMRGALDRITNLEARVERLERDALSNK